MKIEIGPFPEAPKLGEDVEITDRKSLYFGKIGKVVREGEKGGFWIMHQDGNEVYHPWGYQKINTQEAHPE